MSTADAVMGYIWSFLPNWQQLWFCTYAVAADMAIKRAQLAGSATAGVGLIGDNSFSDDSVQLTWGPDASFSSAFADAPDAADEQSIPNGVLIGLAQASTSVSGKSPQSPQYVSPSQLHQGRILAYSQLSKPTTILEG